MPHDPEFVRIVEEQGRRPVGIPVLLFTDATLAEADAPDAGTGAGAGAATTTATATATADGDAGVILEAAEAIGVDIAEVELFTTDAYRIQSVAGHLVVEKES